MTLEKEQNPYLSVPIEKIDPAHDAFCLRYGRQEDEALKESIASLGIRTPLLLLGEEDKLTILSGFARYHSAVACAKKELPARILNGPLSTRDHYELLKNLIKENMEDRGLNPMEQAMALEKASAWLQASDPDREDAVKRVTTEVMPLIGRKPLRQMYERLIAWLELGPLTRQALAIGQIPENAADALGELPTPDQDRLCDSMVRYRMSTGMCRDFSRMAYEVCKRDKINAEDLLLRLNHDDSQSPENPADYRKELLERLRRLRYPILSRQEARFEELHRRLALPDGIRLIPPTHFEGDRFRLEAQLRGKSDFVKMVENISKTLNDKNDTIDAIFRICTEIEEAPES